MGHGDSLRLNDTYVNSLARALADGSALANVPGLLKKVIEGEMWRKRYVKQTGQVVDFRNFGEFVEGDPPEGLRTKLDVLMKICQSYQDMEAVDMLAKVSAGKPGAPIGNQNASKTNSDNITVCFDADSQPERGTGTAYTMRRLAKDFPLFHREVLEGKMSPNAAAKEAGFRAPKFQMPTDPTAAGRYLAGRVDNEWMLACYDAFMKSFSRE